MSEIKVGGYVRRKPLPRNGVPWVYYCTSIGVKPDQIFLVTSINFPLLTIDAKGADLNHFLIESFEVVEPEIQVGDVYPNNEGQSVRIVATDRKTDCNQPILGLVEEGRAEFCHYYTKDGKGTIHDLILPWNQPPKTDWSKVAVDTLIEVVTMDGKKHLRYFAGYDGVNVWFYNDGKTSITLDFICHYDAKKCKVVV